MRELLAEVVASLEGGRPFVYCAVAETRGSTPQKPGAAMLVFPDGGQSGTLGGGCVEAEVRQRALRALHAGEGKPEVATFHLDDLQGWDDGLICGGRMTILLDPVPAAGAGRDAAEPYYRRLRALAEAGGGHTEAVMLAGPSAGDRCLFDADGAAAVCRADPAAVRAAAAHLAPLAERPRPSTRQGIAYLPTWPRVTLLVVGAGHVGQATARLAAEVGFDVWALDDRAQYASRERFPSAARLIVGDVAPTLAELAPTLTPSVYALIMTRGHRHDAEALHRLAETACGYVGLIGSRRKIKLIFDDLLSKGVRPEALARVHAPLGLDIGSQTVPEIAVSIVAELIARRNLGPGRAPRRAAE
jgi:xanthine dehydrogenase accessory factor